MKMYVFDCEVLPNYFLASFMDETGLVTRFELFPNFINVGGLSTMMRTNLTVGFNSNNFDTYLIAGVLAGFDNSTLKRFANALIKSKQPGWKTAADYEVFLPSWNTTDIMDVLPGQASLKMYGARLGLSRLQEMPLPHDEPVDEAGRQIIRDYCDNDLRVTMALAKHIEPQLKLRAEMSAGKLYDLRSKSDAQIAETVLREEMERRTAKKRRPLQLDEDATVKYNDPGIVSFKQSVLVDVFKRLLKTNFLLSPNGSVKMPDWLAETHINIGTASYQMGIGGLHSREKCQTIVPGLHEVLCEVDVESYYPNIILQQKVEPENCRGVFLSVYKDIVEKRVHAKREGFKSTADTLKIVVNGTFGKLGSKYSILYSPQLLLQTTITGQLCLLMLIERLEAVGVRVVSANTDGVVLLFNKALSDDVDQVFWDWMMDTSFNLERTDYRSLHSRDVNNYVAVKHDGSTKGKGVFAAPSLMKNPDFPIVAEAVAKQLSGEAEIWETISTCRDIRKFLCVRNVTGGAVWKDQHLGKTVRFYHSDQLGPVEAIHYAGNGNKVPKSDRAVPVQDLPLEFPGDVDLNHYLNLARKLLKDVGA